VIHGLRALLNLRDYIAINQLEGYGVHREQAHIILSWSRDARPLVDST
jgi:hypothetical protein